MAPLLRAWIVPCHGAQPLKSAFMMPVPRVSVKKRERKPIKPRDGTENSKRTRLDPAWVILVIFPLRTARSWETTPMKSSGTSITKSSIGSCSAPSISRVTTVGLETISS